jgi:hypothetical protein
MGVLAFSPGAFFIDKIRANAPDGAVVAATANRDKVGPEAAVGDITLRQI